MKYVGKMWTHDGDWWFHNKFLKTGDKFDFKNLKTALSFVNDWSYALDIGAHYGSWTRHLATKFKEVGAYEGRPDTYECLLKNTELLPNVHPFNIAIGDRVDLVTIATRPEHLVSKQTGKPNNSGLSTFLGAGSTPMIPIDSLNLPNLGFLKLDIEGYELYALHGAVETLRRHHPVIIFEENKRCLEHGVKFGDCDKYLRSLGATLVKTIRDDKVYIWK